MSRRWRTHPDVFLVFIVLFVVVVVLYRNLPSLYLRRKAHYSCHASLYWTARMDPVQVRMTPTNGDWFLTNTLT